MVADITRPKQPVLYPSVAGLNKKGPVRYIAHLILTKDRVLPLGRETEGDGGSRKPSGHPDQLFWNDAKTLSLADALKKAGARREDLVRVEIDCTILPCDVTNGCVTTVPALMKKVGYDGVPVRVFSHRFEVTTPGAKPARYFDFTVGVGNQQLEEAVLNQGGWEWQA